MEVMRRILPILGIFSLFLAQIAHPIAYRAKIYQNTETKHIIASVRDIHTDIKGAAQTKKQLSALLQGAQKMDAHLIVEDMSTIPVEHLIELGLSEKSAKKIQAIFMNMRPVTAPLPHMIKFAAPGASLNPDEHNHVEWQQAFYHSPLCGLEQACKDQGISVFNAEFRQADNASQLGQPVTVQELLTINNGIVNKRSTFTTAPQSVQELFDETALRYQNNSVTQLLMETAENNPSATLADLEEKQLLPEDNQYDWELLNLTMLDNIYKNKDKKVMVLYGGGDHLAAIEPVLPELGYVEVEQINEEPWESNDLTQFIIPVLDFNNLFERIQTLLADNVNTTNNGSSVLKMVSALLHYPFASLWA